MALPEPLPALDAEFTTAHERAEIIEALAFARDAAAKALAKNNALAEDAAHRQINNCLDALEALPQQGGHGPA